jgi:chromosomal replication initiator protein
MSETMNHHELWQNVLGEIELQISRPNFLTWLKNSQLVEKGEKDGVVLVGLPNNFAKEWVKNRYHKLILGSLRNFDGSVRAVNYTVTANVVSMKPKVQKLTDEQELPLTESKIDAKTNLNPRYSLESFIVGPSNELAHAAVQAVVGSVGKKYNPLFIYGGVGLGKTHLIQGAGNAITAKYQKKMNVLYVTSEKFLNDVVWAIRNKRTEDMKQKYRDVDVLIIDDIQFIGGKAGTELEFFYTFNALYENNKQIIMSSDRPPAAIPTLEERLRSRFEGGMIVDVTHPDYETRIAILKAKCSERGWQVDGEILNHIATKVQKNIRELDGVLNKAVFYQQFKNIPIDLKKLDEIIQETTQVSPKNLVVSDILKTVAEFFEIPISDLTERGRKQEVVEPRQITMYLLRDILRMSYPHIGEKLGKRDHTTVIHAYEKINKELSHNTALAQKILLIKERLFKN